MTHPEYLYYAGVTFVALPLVPFNQLASLVVAAWVPGLIVARAGGDARPVALVCALLALATCVAIARRRPEHFSVPAAGIVACFAGIGAAALALFLSYLGWWADYWIALAQLALLPFAMWRRPAKLFADNAVPTA